MQNLGPEGAKSKFRGGGVDNGMRVLKQFRSSQKSGGINAVLQLSLFSIHIYCSTSQDY